MVFDNLIIGVRLPIYGVSMLISQCLHVEVSGDFP